MKNSFHLEVRLFIRKHCSFRSQIGKCIFQQSIVCNILTLCDPRPKRDGHLGKTKTDEFFTIQLWKVNSNPEPSKKLINGNISAILLMIFTLSLPKTKWLDTFELTTQYLKILILQKVSSLIFTYFYLQSDPK